MITRSNQTIETVCLVVFFLERKKEFGKEMSKIAGCGIFMKKEWELYNINSQYLSVSDLLRPLAYSSELTT